MARPEGAAVFRPLRARVVIYGCAALLLVALLGGNLFLPTRGAGAWGLGSRVALALFALAAVLLLHRLAAVRVEVDDEGATVVNIVHSRRLAWPEIVGVRLRGDDPWLLLDLSDGESLAAMGVQKADGARAERQAQAFARMVQEHSRTARDD
jgi:hypothetical protein